MKNIAQAMRLKEELDKLRPIEKDQEAIIMQKFRLDWDYHSNHLEGNSLTFGETKTLILHGITAQGKPLKDHFEITGHDEAIKLVIEVVKEEYPLTEVFIRELHKLLLKEPYEVDAITPDGKPTKKRIQIGTYKSSPNHVRTKTGEIFRFASPEETPAMMQDLLKWYKEKKQSPDLNPIVLAADFHYKFIRIHPFDDGNGRMARILMNFILMQYGYPPVIIKTEDKSNYFAALQQADGGNFEPFADYIAVNLVRSLEIMISGAKGESIEEPDDLDKEISLLEQKLKHLSKKTEIVKSKEVVLELFDNSIRKVVESLYEDSQKFTKFYLQYEFKVFTGKLLSKSPLKELDLIKNSVDDSTSNIEIIINFISFNREGFGNFDFMSYLEINLGLSGYAINNRYSNLTIEKGYEEQLTQQEINKLAKEESLRHKNFIDNKIREYQKKKK